MRPQATFSFFIFLQLFHFVAPSSSSLLPPRPSFLLVPPSSSPILPPCSSFFLVQYCLNHLESIKGHFFLNLIFNILPNMTFDPRNAASRSTSDDFDSTFRVPQSICNQKLPGKSSQYEFDVFTGVLPKEPRDGAKNGYPISPDQIFKNLSIKPPVFPIDVWYKKAASHFVIRVNLL